MASALRALDIGKNGRAVANSVIIIFFICYLLFRRTNTAITLLTKLNLQVISNHLLIFLWFNRMEAELLRLVVYEVRDAVVLESDA